MRLCELTTTSGNDWRTRFGEYDNNDTHTSQTTRHKKTKSNNELSRTSITTEHHEIEIRIM